MTSPATTQTTTVEIRATWTETELVSASITLPEAEIRAALAANGTPAGHVLVGHVIEAADVQTWLSDCGGYDRLNGSADHTFLDDRTEPVHTVVEAQDGPAAGAETFVYGPRAEARRAAAVVRRLAAAASARDTRDKNKAVVLTQAEIDALLLLARNAENTF